MNNMEDVWELGATDAGPTGTFEGATDRVLITGGGLAHVCKQLLADTTAKPLKGGRSIYWIKGSDLKFIIWKRRGMFNVYGAEGTLTDQQKWNARIQNIIRMLISAGGTSARRHPPPPAPESTP
jgi:hypothetical protein